MRNHRAYTYSTSFIAVLFSIWLGIHVVQAQVNSQDYVGTWSGTWFLTQQISITPAGSISHNFNNKIITIQESVAGGDELIEDYFQLKLVNPENYPVPTNCTSSGQYQVPIELTDNGPVINGALRTVVQQPNITCSGGGDPSLGGTNAVPLSLTVAGDSAWQFAITDNTLTATITLGPSTTTQTYQRSTTDSITDAGNANTNQPDSSNVNENSNSNDDETSEDVIEPVIEPIDFVDATVLATNELEEQLQEQAVTAYERTGAQPIQYSAFTTSIIEWTPEQAVAIQSQIEADIQTNTELVVDAPDNTVRVIREIGWRSQDPEIIGSVTLNGQIDVAVLEELGLPEGMPLYIVVTVFSTPIVKIAQADESGAWTLTIPAELLVTDEHIAFAAAEVNGIQTNQIEVTKFVVEEQVRLSNTTWLVMINAIIVGIILIVLLIVRIRQRKQKQAYI